MHILIQLILIFILAAGASQYFEGAYTTQIIYAAIICTLALIVEQFE